MVPPRLDLAIVQNTSLPEAFLRIRELMIDKHSDLDGFSKLAGAVSDLTANSCAYGICPVRFEPEKLIIIHWKQPLCIRLTR
jgi:hypothetical protein